MSGTVRRGRRVTAGLVATAAALLVSTGCASIPVSSPPRVIPQSVPAAAPDGNDVRYAIDFRSVYAQVIDRWLGGNSQSVLGGNFARADLAFI